MPPREHAAFDPAELAIVLSHFDLGVIESITDLLRGSARSPKVGIVCEKGKFVLKRRAVNRASPDRVHFSHKLYDWLLVAGVPVARLIPVRGGPQRSVRLRENVYELFDFIGGHAFARTAEESGAAGAMLGRFHLALESFVLPTSTAAPAGDYHDAAGTRTGLCAIGSTLATHDSFTGDEAELAGLIQYLLGAYDAAAERGNAFGFANLPTHVIHSDWHPGNLLFRNNQVVAVLDLDSARLSRRLIDVANGALQFSMIAGGDPETWPDHLDEPRYQAFLAGYSSLVPLSPAERRVLPDLMTEALIAECVPPITETGSVGRWSGFRVLQMAKRKLVWLAAHADRLFA